jgi:hypothetical protein
VEGLNGEGKKDRELGNRRKRARQIAGEEEGSVVFFFGVFLCGGC